MPDIPAANADFAYMARALQLARKGQYTTSPNPQVGCVIVSEGEIVGEGWHQYAGQGHAEINALAVAGERARGATLYVTLEPCSHHGRTPPCSEAVCAAGIARVVVAMRDPNPLVAGKGLARLRQQAIGITCGVLESSAQSLLAAYVSRITGCGPRVLLKLAISLDGRTAMADGSSQWITGPAARLLVQQLRARSCAIITGIETILHDDAALTVRPDDWRQAYGANAVRQPLRVVLDSRLRTPLQARVLSAPGETCLAYVGDTQRRGPGLQQAGATLLRSAAGQVRVDLPALLGWLANERHCNQVLVEAGATVAGSFLQQGLVDELHIFQAPLLLGSRARPMAELPLERLADGLSLKLAEQRQVGNDLYRIYQIDKTPRAS